MSARRHLRMVDKLSILAHQGKCPRCGERLGTLSDLDWDHIIPLALGGADAAGNIQALHRSCHSTKTNGPGGTKRICSAGGDRHAIAHVRRLAVAREAFEERQALFGAPLDIPLLLTPPKKPSRQMPGGRESRFKRKMNGKVVPRKGKPS